MQWKVDIIDIMFNATNVLIIIITKESYSF